MLTLTTLASGSSGNCMLVSAGGTHILVDAGISARRICMALQGFDIGPAELDGILVTHEHTDHMAGLATLNKKYHIPVYTSPGTGRRLCYRIAALEDVLHPCAPGTVFSLGGVDIETFPTLHDAAEPMGFALSDGSRKAAVVTDLGCVTDEVLHGISGADLLVVEANHDADWVRSGPYPPVLKRRILGDHGHLSNEDGGFLARKMAEKGTRTVILAHLSKENNTPEHARQTVKETLRDCLDVVTLAVAPRSEPGPCYAV